MIIGKETKMFEKVVKRISATVAGCIVFILISGMYLSFKGFQVDENGNFVLVKQAQAKENSAEKKEIPLNFGFPQDHISGSKDAKVTLYEYSSFGCTHCADFHLETLPAIASHSWITIGVFVNFAAKSIGALTYPPVPKTKSGLCLRM